MKLTDNLLNNQNYTVGDSFFNDLKAQVYGSFITYGTKDYGIVNKELIIGDKKSINKLLLVSSIFYIMAMFFVYGFTYTIFEFIVAGLILLPTVFFPFILFNIDQNKFKIKDYHFYLSKDGITKKWIIIYIKKNYETNKQPFK